MSEGSLRTFVSRIRTAVSRTPAAGTDRELLARFADARDESAFADLVRSYGRLVRNVCRNVLGDEHDAEEATQATFLLLARRASALRQTEVLAGWLHGAAYRTALCARRDLLRRRAREARACPPRESSLPGPVAEASWRELQAIVDEELQRLPERLRSPFALCCLEGHGHGEAARLLGWKTGTVSSRLAEARQLLRRRLSRRGVSLSAVLGGLAVAGGAARAGLPAALVSETVAAAVRFVRGGDAGPAGRLAGDVLRSGRWIRVAAAAVLSAVAGVLVIGLGVKLRSPETPGAGPEAAVTRIPQPLEADPPRLDRFGDALPDDAIARLGTNRFGHDWYTESTVWSPDGKVIASLGGGSTARPLCLWDAATGRQLHQLVAQGEVRAAAFSPDGKTLAAAEGKQGVALWDVRSGQERDRWTVQGESVAVAFAPDGRTVASGGGRGVIQVREAAGGRLVVEMKVPGEPLLRRVAYAPDGKTLASTDQKGGVILWDLAAGTERWHKRPHGEWAWGLAFSPDGKSLATTGADGVIRVRDVAGGDDLASFGNAVKEGLLIAYSPDGRALASPGPADFVCLWDPSTGREKRRWHTGEEWLLSVSYSPDGRTLATTGFMGSRVRLWDPETGAEIRPAAGHNALVYGLSFSADGKTVWSAGADRAVIRWDVASGKGQPLPGVCPEGYFHPTAFSRGGRTIATGAADGSVQLWSTDGRLPGTPAAHGVIVTVALPPDGKVLASSGTDRTVRFFDVTTGRELRRAETAGDLWGCLAFSPDGRKLALARGALWGAEPAPRVLDVLTGKEICRLESVAAAAEADAAVEAFVSFSPDGKTLATVGTDRGTVVRFWDAATGQLVGHCGGGTGCQFWYCLAFSPDGRLLATGPYDHDDTVHLWEVATCQEVTRLRGHRGGVTALAFSPDGRSLASGGGDGTVLVWDLTGCGTGRKRRTERLSPSRLEECWEALRGEDAAAAYRAVRTLAADPADSVPFLARRLRPAGRDAETPWSRQRRAVMALEYCATPGARQLLQALAGMAAEDRLAAEVREALARLNGTP